jgi:diaminopimelate decarboxylase
MTAVPLAPAPGDVDGPARPWWRRPGLEIGRRPLAIAGRDAEALAREHGTPLFVYDRRRFVENAERLISALDRAGIRHVVRFALKANPDPGSSPPFADSLGIDACSPGEVVRALDCGWSADGISYTGDRTMSERDLDVVLAQPLHLNLDAISQIERVGRRLAALGSNDRVRDRSESGSTRRPAPATTTPGYSGARPTKFGIYEDRLARRSQRRPATGSSSRHVHVHVGSGWLADGLAAFEAAIARVARSRAAPGGRPPDHRGERRRRPRRAGPLGRAGDRCGRVRRDDPPALGDLVDAGVIVGCEPGDYLAKDAAILLGEVVTVEERGGRPFVGSTWAGTSTARTSSIDTPRSSSPARRRRAPDASGSRSPATSTRRATSSPRTTRCRRSGRATSSRS